MIHPPPAEPTVTGAAPPRGPAPAAQPAGRIWLWGQRQPDLRNLALLAAAWIALLLLIPPQHEYPIIDDWIYAGSVRQVLHTGVFTMPAMSQANLIGLTMWGALWAGLLGFSFTTLTYSTLFMAGVALAAFYGLARAVGVPPAGALFGTALLEFNPLFVHLSYSFMTDVPFLALLLLACYCYVCGLQEPTGARGLAWLWEAGLFTGWAFLIRQFALLAPLVFAGVLLLDGLRTRRWRWREWLLIVLVPGVIMGAWTFTTRDWPPTVTAVAAMGRQQTYVFREPWLRVFLLRAFAILPLTALLAWGAVVIPRARRRWLPAVAVGVAVAIYAVDLPTETWISVTEPPFTARLGPFGLDLPQEPFTFGGVGNLLRVGGLDFFEYNQAPIWSPAAWRALWVAGLALAALLLAGMAAGLWDGLRALWQGRPFTPLAGCYLLGASIFVASLAFPGDLFDRYILGFLPFVILFVVRGAAGWGRRAWAYSGGALALIALFTVLAKADQIDHDNARWAAGRWMQARGVPAHVGFDWDNWVQIGVAPFQVADMPLPGFRIEQTFPYTSRLSGWTTRTVLAQTQAGVPPLPSPVP